MENVHTYAHARRVRNVPQRTKMRYQTFLWPTSMPPPSYPDYQHEFSGLGPPVRHVEDLIASHLLSIHRPDVFKLPTSAVLDSVSDREFDSYEQKKKQEATRRFREKYTTHLPDYRVETSTSGDGSKRSNNRKKTPKRSKFFDDPPESSITWRTKNQYTTGSQVTEHVNIHYAEEIILSPVCEVIIEQQFDPPLVHYPTVTLVPQAQRAHIVEVRDEFQEQASCRQQDSNDLWNTVVKPARWSKRMTGSYSLLKLKKRTLFKVGVEKSYHRLSRQDKEIEMICNVTSPFLRILRNFKKRRRKCESEYAH